MALNQVRIKRDREISWFFTGDPYKSILTVPIPTLQAPENFIRLAVAVLPTYIDAAYAALGAAGAPAVASRSALNELWQPLFFASMPPISSEAHIRIIYNKINNRLNELQTKINNIRDKDFLYGGSSKTKKKRSKSKKKRSKSKRKSYKSKKGTKNTKI